MAFREPEIIALSATACTSVSGLNKVTSVFINSIIDIAGDGWELEESSFTGSGYIDGNKSFSSESLCFLKNTETSSMFTFFVNQSGTSVYSMKLVGTSSLDGYGNSNTASYLRISTNNVMVAKHKRGILVFDPSTTSGYMSFTNIVKDAIFTCMMTGGSTAGIAVSACGDNTRNGATSSSSLQNMFEPKCTWHFLRMYSGNNYFTFLETHETESLEPTGMYIAVAGQPMLPNKTYYRILMNDEHYIVFGYPSCDIMIYAFCLGS